MNVSRGCGAAAVAGLLFSGGLQAQSYTNESWVLDGGGGRSSGDAYVQVSAWAQPGGILCSTNGALQNYAGFLGTFVLRPDLDHNGNGLPDEYDADNDGDGLGDRLELAGTAFSPTSTTDLNRANSDGDPADDGEESVAGTDPNDPDAYLTILNIARAGSNVDITWRARGGKSYRFLGHDGPSYDLPATVLGTQTVAGGSAPWYVRTNTVQDAGSGLLDARYYRIQVLP